MSLMRHFRCMSANDNRFINLSSVRREDQRDVMVEIAKQGHCPFCVENLKKYHKNPILKEGKFWFLTENQWPYEKVKEQLLAIYKTHIEHISEMHPEAGGELLQMFSDEAKKRNIGGGVVAIRFGSSELGDYGSSVKHIHAHLIEPDLEQLGETEALKFTYAKPKNYRKK
jgi:diadenosine tetraphosphate (Ap4A) HIT family hydrolase